MKLFSDVHSRAEMPNILLVVKSTHGEGKFQLNLFPICEKLYIALGSNSMKTNRFYRIMGTMHVCNITGEI
jgi:hypothetical protein